MTRARVLGIAGGVALALLALLLWFDASLSAREYMRSGRVHRAFLQQTGYPQGRPGYVADHMVPLCAGGTDAVDNLQWQTVADAHVKDKAEWALCWQIRRLVAQFETDWIPVP